MMAGNSSDEDDDFPTAAPPSELPAAPGSPVPEPESPVPDPVEPAIVLLSSQEGPEDDHDDAGAAMTDPVLRDERPEDDEDMEPKKKAIEDEQGPSSGSNGDSTVPPPFDAVVEKKHVFEHDTTEDTNAKIKALQKMLADAKKLQTAKNLYSPNWFVHFRFLISTKHLFMGLSSPTPRT